MEAGKQSLNRRRIVCLNPMQWKWVQEKGILPHVLLLNKNLYWERFYLVHPDTHQERIIHLKNNITILEFSKSKYKKLDKIGLKFLDYILSEIYFLVKMVKFVKRNKISVIKSQEPYLNGIRGVILKILTRTPLVEDVRSNYDLTYKTTGQLAYPQLKFRWLEKILERITFKTADMVFGGNKNNLDFALRNGVSPKKSFVVRNIGVAPLHFEPLSSRKDIRKELGFSGKKAALYIGRLSGEKYPEDAVRFAAEVVKHQPAFVLFMLGKGPMEQELLKLRQDLKVEKAVKFLGFRPQQFVRDLMFSVDVIIATQAGSSLVESALSATPIVAYDFEWSRELITNQKTGILVPFKDYKSMARSALKVFQSPLWAQGLGRAAREFAVQQHHPDIVTRYEEECFDKLLNRRKKRQKK